jgi:hypothetical protein
MNFSFGIVTLNGVYLDKIIDSIELLNIPNYEIIIIGNVVTNRNNTKIINFDESIKSSWITKKKNLITKNAQYNNIVYLHDYFVFDKEWYSEFLNFGDDFHICMNQIINLNGDRYRDWCIWPGSSEYPSEIILKNREYIIPYDITHLSKYMYISGGYWVAKKHVMLEFPLNENLIWGQSEDVEWSFRVRQKFNFSINDKSIVRLLKQNKRSFNIMTDNEQINFLKNYK